MWTLSRTPIQPRISQYRILENGTTLTFELFIHYLTRNTDFRKFYNNTLATCPFPAYAWEHPPMTRQTLTQAYEFVLVRNEALNRLVADPTAFAEHFPQADKVADFQNLGRDAHLIVPTPESEVGHYTHLANFVRHAPPAQQDAFWQRVGEKYGEAIQQGKRWLSTAGLGVAWLHVRIDTYPKYYRFTDYAVN